MCQNALNCYLLLFMNSAAKFNLCMKETGQAVCFDPTGKGRVSWPRLTHCLCRLWTDSCVYVCVVICSGQWLGHSRSCWPSWWSCYRWAFIAVSASWQTSHWWFQQRRLDRFHSAVPRRVSDWWWFMGFGSQRLDYNTYIHSRTYDIVWHIVKEN